MRQYDLDKLIDKATVEQLRDMVHSWIEKSSEFRDFVEYSLNPPIEEIDFDAELERAMLHEAYMCGARRGAEILDWSNIYYYTIEPWAKKAESLTTPGLWNLTVAIITRIAMVLDDNDISGDDWYGNDYTQDIANILDALGNICGLLVTRPDLTEDRLSELAKMVEETQEVNKIGDDMATPYDTIQELICMRRESNMMIRRELYQMMIEANFNNEAGIWICRIVDFLRVMGIDEGTLYILKDNIKYPEVCLKYYNELMAENRWQEAIELLDEAHKLRKEKTQRWFGTINPDWLSMKQNLLREYGSKEMQIANLTEMFYENIGEKKKDCYMQLKELVTRKEWKDFYTDLLSRKPINCSFELDSIAPYLVIEEEWEWLIHILEENEQRDRTDYRLPLKYASALMSSHNNEIRSMLVRTFREYAANRFATNKRVSSDKYVYYCHDLQSLADIGAKEELIELIQYFKTTYSRRPSFIAELRKIKVL